MIFDIKTGNFHRNAQMVAGGHMIAPPPTITYASMVSRETICINLAIATLNDLKVMAAEILNVCIFTLNKEKD
jgi:hypothetical protein